MPILTTILLLCDRDQRTDEPFLAVSAGKGTVMTRKSLALLAAIGAFLALQGPVLAGELALKVSTDKKLALAQRYLSDDFTELEKVDAKTFGLPPGSAFQAEINLDQTPDTSFSDTTVVTLLLTYSSENKTPMPDELRVAVGEKPDFSTIQPLTADTSAPTLFQRPSQTLFTNVKFDFTHADQQYPLTMDITIHRDGKYPQYVMYKLTTVRAGKLKLDGKTVKAVLIDSNGNGLFNDSGPRRRGDVLLIDANNSGKLERVRGQSYYDFGGEIFPVTPMLQIDSQYYKCVIPPSGASLSLEAIQPELGHILAGGENLKAQLLGPVFVTTSASKSETITVPVGKYNVLKLNETRLDKSGRKWSIEVSTYDESAPALEVKAGQTVSIPPTKLIKIVAETYESDENEREIDVEFQTAQGLEIEDVQVGNKRPKAPTYEIHDSSGKLVASGKLKYG